MDDEVLVPIGQRESTATVRFRQHILKRRTKAGDRVDIFAVGGITVVSNVLIDAFDGFLLEVLVFCRLLPSACHVDLLEMPVRSSIRFF